MKRLLLVLVLLAGGITAAAFTVPSDAATVDGSSISQASLNADLAAIKASPAYQCALDAQVVVQSKGRSALPPIEGVGNGTYNTTFVDYWLTQMINTTLVRQLAAAHGATLTASQINLARSQLLQSMQATLNDVAGSQFQCQVTPSQVLSTLPSSFGRKLVAAQAYTDLLLSQSPGSAVSDAALRRYFATHRSSFDTICVSGILVSSQSTANQLRSQIESGASFSQLARTNSLDTASAANGGALGCFKATSSSYASVRQDVGSLAVGQVTQPLASSGGSYVLLEVTSRTPATFSAVRSAVRAVVLGNGASRANTVLRAAARRAHVSVNPAYGRWSPLTVSHGVLAPLSPPPTTVLNPSVNIPRYATSSTGAAPGSSG